ncbi:MAG: bifunctional demethylmenaquinone methyltransferase/2-methoxy-6-polyprenyl-1,4-benzoquinol methylase UbiE [Acidobacteriota bacterium]|nr:bifunctional demethylmenaquinone methyltransferase/2-methoxy-6-polyprenyl-1,4-benzoquinol methylase UbiE [Acidobacteriota bacterium]
MFDSIARRYDTLNHLLSAGLDKRWRARAVRELGLQGGERVLDVCTGTGDLAVALLKGGRAKDVIGVDFSHEMLKVGVAKVRGSAQSGRVHLARGDAMRLPLPDASVEAAAIGFGIRNVERPDAALREVARVMRPGGRLAILEFGFPRIPGIAGLYKWYFRAVLPRVGRAVSKHGKAYSYLPASVERFPSPEAFSNEITSAGFSRVRTVPLALGIVYLYIAEL